MESSYSATLEQPLITPAATTTYGSLGSTLRVTLQWTLFIAIWAVFILLIAQIVLFPCNFYLQFLDIWFDMTGGSFFGYAGSTLLIYAVPIVIIAFLGILYIEISPKEALNKKNKSEYPRLRSWTFPVLVDGPFGVVSAAELVVIILTVIYIVATMAAFIISDNTTIGRIPLPSYEKRWYREYFPPPILMLSVVWMIPLYVEANRSCRNCFLGVVTLSVSSISCYGLSIHAYAEK